MNREAISAAIFAKLQTVSGIVTFSRKFDHWDNVPSSQQPALYLHSVGQEVHRKRGEPPKVVMEFDVVVYAHADNAADLPQTIQNNLLDAIDTALKPDNLPDQPLTLGGLCHDCRIEGKIETDEGCLGKQTVLIIPLKVIAST